MDRDLLKNAEKYHKKLNKKKTWKKAVSVLGCMVVFCVTYALVLPAITQEEETFCQKTEHLHEDSCYAQVTTGAAEQMLICPISVEEAHVHDERCYELQGGHAHTDACFLREVGELLCTLEEEPGHAHNEECYLLKELLCTAQEGHVHKEDCYLLSEPQCAMQEGHIHVESCYLLGELLCTAQENHSHEEGCFEPGALTCTAAEGHSHVDGCYVDGVLTCVELEGHLHDANCYAEPTLICTEPENHVHGSVCHAEAVLLCAEPENHVHGPECCAQPVLLCAEPENHIHTLDCYLDPSLTCGKQENHIHDSSCYAQMVCVCTDQEAHVHSADCYVEHAKICPEAQNGVCSLGCVTTPMLICAEEENHVHSLDCYIRELICESPEREGHSHDVQCYQVTETLICTLEEAPGEPVLICTKPEADTESMAEEPIHVHDESCYVSVVNELTCTLPEDENHEHSTRCYGVWSLACGLEEHTHDLTCRADLSADWETAADWESSFSYVSLSGVWADDVLAIAESQLGYEESQRNYIVPEGTTETKGYTRYGDWYGDPYGDWCGMFVSFCLHYAEVDQTVFPIDCNCSSWRMALEARDLYREAQDYLPVPGDLVFFARNGSEITDHVGLVKAYDPEKEQITTIEGNKYNAVASAVYFVDDAQIVGYGALPKKHVEEPIVLTEQTLDALIYTDGTYLQPAEDSTVITVSGMLPEGAEARAYPVMLETDLIDGQTVIMAYDISIFYGEEQLYEQADTPLSVTFRPADWEAQPEDADYNIYYIPEEGEPEPVETVVDEQAVNFLTDHFSTYAMTSGGTASNVYLNGETGKDTNSGTSANSPVKTIEKAMSLVKNGGTIYISGTVTVTDWQEWDVDSKVTIKRYSSFTGPLIIVSNDGGLELRNITINGGSVAPSSSNIATNSTFASGSAKAPLIVVNNGGRLDVNAGTVLEYNSNKPNSSNNIFEESGYIGLGGAIYCNGTLTMNGGQIRYCEAQCGGGVYVENYVENANFYLNGGTIDHNYARDIVSYRNRMENYHKNAGGGVYVGDNSTMTMTGGTVSYNQSSREGGGISLGWLNRSNGSGIESYITTFTMNGGTIDNNYATSTGGGLNITAGRQAFINAGYITNNKADGHEYQDSDTYVNAGTYTEVFSGGGIYIDAKQWTSYPNNYSGVAGKAVINRALITQNTATYNGGGIAACGTSNNYVYGSETNGTAIYDNSSNEVYVYGGSTEMGDTVLGGGKYNWKKSGNTWNNTLTDSSAAIVKAKELATVFITNNTGYLGGGIGCNGLIEIGGEKEESTYINIIKKWTDNNAAAHPPYIEVQILQDGKPYGNLIRIYRIVENGNEVWPTFYVGGLPGDHEYTVQELDVPGYEALIEQEGNDCIITNVPASYKVTKKWLDEDGKTPLTSDVPAITVQLYQNGVPYGEPIVLNANNNWVYRWQDLPETDSSGNTYDYTVKELDTPDGFYSKVTVSGKAYTITNTKSPVTTISVEKQWADGTPGADSVQVQLYQNGVPYRAITLSAENQWFYKWTDLPTKTTTGEDAKYTVKEVPIPGYTSTVEETLYKVDGGTFYQWEEVTGLENGKTYLFVNSSNQALASNSYNSNLKWVNVSTNLENGTEPENGAMWTYNNSTLQSKAGRKLTTTYRNQTYMFSTSSNSGNTITFADRKLSYKYSSNYTYYLTGISDGYGSSSTKSSNAMTFTAYERTSTVIEAEENTHFIITNVKGPAELEVKFAKYSTGTDSSGNPTLLAGAELALYLADDTADKTIPGTEVAGILIDKWTSKIASGGIHVNSLASGTYYLVEIKAPADHMGLNGPIIFVVDAEAGTATITEYPSRPEEETVVEGVLPIYNSVMVTLPETGGVGTTPYRLLGVGMMLAAVLILYRGNKPRRRGRRAEGS